MDTKVHGTTLKKVLITGATSGIGLQLAKDYQKQGWQVFGCGRNITALEDQHNIIPLQFDVTNKEQIHLTVETISPQEHKLQLDLVILNAGDCKYINDPIHFDDEIFEHVIKTNLISIGYCLSAFMPLIKANGRIAFMSSSASFLPLPRSEAYGASKAAIAYLADSLRIDLAKHGIHVSTIYPGFVKTPLTDKNDFPMPACIDVISASNIIRHQIAKGKNDIHFPKRLTLTLKFLSLFPSNLWKKIASSLLTKNY